MTYLNGKEPLKGDTIICPDGNGGMVVGTVEQLYERTGQLKIGYFSLRLRVVDCVLASDAYDALVQKPASGE